ncbi:hypothetical protein HYDPIDRAFT_115393 [Hydnomerulius pinastri MD-312]|uniref:DUF6534 domain-containing protein n=1 Tax=Hydnomerulius pinastri MD-312 TaxID=994086 RepID=A0A0C9W5D8_9AGAM|nr:hypothetical protein HYDPIDRAFT_115393 [Hydnomerulius pinastri MD-312]
MTGLVTTLTHGFFCWRIWVLRRSLLVLVLVMTVSLVQFASLTNLGFTNGLLPYDYGNSVAIGAAISPFIGAWLGGSLFCDLTITIYMILGLRKSRSQFHSTRLAFAMLTRLTIETGLITTTAALVELVLGTVYPDTMYHIAVFYTISKLYANCLLASLNFRLVLRDSSDSHIMVAVWDGSRLGLQTEERPQPQGSNAMHITAKVRTDVDTDDYLTPHLGPQVLDTGA